jgi:hypothetical protein
VALTYEYEPVCSIFLLINQARNALSLLYFSSRFDLFELISFSNCFLGVPLVIVFWLVSSSVLKRPGGSLVAKEALIEKFIRGELINGCLRAASVL